jgi:phosphoribosylformylglycinamidine synthase
MAAPAVAGEAADLYAAVHAVGMELCPALGITIPVGKDSMSMSTVWPAGGADRRVTSPVSLIVSAFAPVTDIRLTLTPQLQAEDDSELLLIDLGRGRDRLGGSILAQVFLQTGEAPPDVDRPADLRGFWDAIQQLGREGLLLAYHDRSDGGLLVTLVEMAFAGRRGIVLELPAGGSEPFAALFAEELGAVVQIPAAQRARVLAVLAEHGLADCTHPLGRTTAVPRITVRQRGRNSGPRTSLPCATCGPM